MKGFHGSATAHVDEPAEAVFDLVTDLDRLPAWNAAIELVAERPAELADGAEWLVVMHPPHMPTWKSRSRVEAIDRHEMRFVYETRNADGNPSYAKWTWEVAPTETGATVTVHWDVHLETIDRRLMAGPLRRRQLAREVPNSLKGLAAELARAR